MSGSLYYQAAVKKGETAKMDKRNALFNPQGKQAELHKVLLLLWNAVMGPKHHIYQLHPLS